MLPRLFSNKLSILAVILFSALMYFLSTGLQGDYWFLLWFAPIPILLYSFFGSTKSTFWIAFIAYTLSEMNLIIYYMKILPPLLAILVIFMLGFLFAVIILLNKIMIAGLNKTIAIFIFPILITVVGFIMNLFDGTFGNMVSQAYTQVNNTYLIQIVSITGMYGIPFTIALFSSLITFLLLKKSQKFQYRTFIIPLLILMGIFLYGILRLNHAGITNPENANQEKPRHFQTVCLDIEHLVTDVNKKSPEYKDLLLKQYVELIDKIDSRRIDCVLLPEKITTLDSVERSKYYPVFSDLAYRKKCLIIVGWTLQTKIAKNIATIFLPDGKSILEYQKRYLVSGWEKGFAEGNRNVIFDYKKTRLGVAICKDMDYPGWIRKYSAVDILLVPAWDFQLDNWLHSRIAVLRGLENGFTIIRSAKEGDLTVSDPYGRIIKEKTYSTNSYTNEMSAGFILVKLNTFYSRSGDWFCWLNLIASFILISYSFTKSPETRFDQYARRQ